jgi:hypothetical protein
LEQLRLLEHTSKHVDVNDNLTQGEKKKKKKKKKKKNLILFFFDTKAKINKLTIQLEKARIELEGEDPKAMDMRNHQPAAYNTAVKKKKKEKSRIVY